MPISYLEFKLNKEISHQDTFEKDEKIRKEYQEYIKRINKKKGEKNARQTNIL
tara:strand:+ start:254 stop:412 length:159 start_codon:yes stop_codon:yes gene_type:complete